MANPDHSLSEERPTWPKRTADNIVNLFEDANAQEVAEQLGLTAGMILKPGHQLDSKFEAFASDALLPIFYPKVYQHKDLIYDLSADFEIPVNVIAMLMGIESGGNEKSLSQAGARGLFQVMPGNFDNLGVPEELWLDPETNGRIAMVVYKENLASARVILDPNRQALRDHHPEIYLRAMAYYNGGRDGDDSYETWQLETQQYVQHGKRFFQVCEIAAGLRMKGYDDRQIVEALQSVNVDARAYAYSLSYAGFKNPDAAWSYLSTEPMADSNSQVEHKAYQAYREYTEGNVDRYQYPLNPALRAHASSGGAGFVYDSGINESLENWLSINSLPDN